MTSELIDPVVAVALIPCNEPVFILRASDPAAPAILTLWAEQTLARTGDQLLARLGFDQAHAMREWQRRLAAAQEPHQGSIAGPGASEAGK